jgi:hypothetical protein
MNHRRADLQLGLPLNVDMAVLLDLREQFTIGVSPGITEKCMNTEHRKKKLMYIKIPMYMFFVLVSCNAMLTSYALICDFKGQ